MKAETQEKLAVQIVKLLKEQRHTAYFAGGCVRDLVMRQKPKDYDIATTAKPDEVEKIFSKCIPVGRKFGVMIVVFGEFHFEVATFRKDEGYQDSRHPDRVLFTDPKEDAMRRDFTVNGLFYDPLQKKIIDFVDGAKDIRKKQIRAIGDPARRFGEDHLRLLRAVRFAANLGFNIESKTWAALEQLSSKIHTVSPERVRDELVKMFTRPHGGRALELLSESGLLREVLPEIEAMKGVRQQPDFHPEGDVFIHTKLLLDKLKSPSTELAFGSLLHDVGKPATYSEEDGAIHFYNHAHVGAEIAEKMLTRLRFSNRQIDGIVSCVENHMKFADVKKMRIGKLKQFTVRDNFETELELHRIDCLSSHGQLDLYRFLKRKIKEFQKEALKPKRFLNGHDLLAIGVKAGPAMKEILEEAYTLQLEGGINSKEEACRWAKDFVAKPKQGRRGKK